MEFERKRYNNNSYSYINIAPLVDVVFLLLLFFMLTSQFVQEPAVKINLPESETATTEQRAMKTITISREGNIFFMGKRIDLIELQNEIEKHTDIKETIRIKADREAGVGVMIKVIDILRLSGINNFSIVTEKAE
jgi:biopolymer transport protein ExbD